MLKQVNGILGKKHKCQNDFLSKIFFLKISTYQMILKKLHTFACEGGGIFCYK